MTTHDSLRGQQVRLAALIRRWRAGPSIPEWVDTSDLEAQEREARAALAELDGAIALFDAARDADAIEEAESVGAEAMTRARPVARQLAEALGLIESDWVVTS